MANGNDNWINAHEDRLQNVESVLNGVVAKTAEIGVKQDYLQRSVEERSESILKQIEEGFADLRASQKQVKKDHEHLEARIEPFEADRKLLTKRLNLLKKLVIPALAAAMGFFTTKFSEVIFNWFK